MSSISGCLIIVLCVVSCAFAHSHHHQHDDSPSSATDSVKRSHRCSHTDADIRRLFYHHGMDVTMPQRYKQTTPDPDDKKHHFEAQAARSKIRISISTLDLEDSTKYCTVNGGVAPNFQGGTSTCTTDDIFTSSKKDILVNTLLPAAIKVLSDALLVTPVEGNLVVSTSGCSQITKASTHTTTGVANTDYLLYVGAGPTPSGVLAFAGPCNFDQNGRPTVGFANFGPAGIKWGSDVTTNEQTLATAVHEILHALGFSYSFATSRFVGKSSSEVVKDVTLRGKTAKVIFTPEILSKAKTYFACDTLEGVELEDEGGAGSALAHWDRRVLFEELMTASGGTKLSVLTLAFMKDSGHYDVDYSKAQEITFAKQAGCGFIDSKCNTASGGKDEWFCFDTDNTNRYCTFDHKAIGYCSVGTYGSALPAYFQYFSNPNLGGVEFVDQCPIVNGYNNRICNQDSQATSNNEQLALNQQGYYFGNGGRCFSTSGIVQANLNLQSDTSTRCFESRCPTSSQIEFRVGTSNTWVQCPTDGSAGTVSAPAGFKGTVNCPAAKSFCDLNITINPDTPAPTPAPPAETPAPETPTPETPSPGSTPSPDSTAVVITPSPNASSTPSPDSTPAPETPAPATTPAPETPTPATPVPLSTIPTGEPQYFQLTSSLSVGQFNTATRIHIEGVIAVVLGLPAVSVSVEAIMNGVGSYAGATVVRFKVVSALTESQIVAAVNVHVSNSSSTLQSSYKVITSSTQLVVDCATVCNSKGTITSFRTSDNTACICTCQNQYEGSTCSTCPSKYTGDLCDFCAGGLVGYPDCSAQPTCTQPTVTRYQPNLDIGCTVFVSSQFGDKQKECESTRCSCVGGSYEKETRLCTHLAGDQSTDCQKFICDGEERECLFQKQLAVMKAASECEGNTAQFIEGAEKTRAWCKFDACLDSRNICKDGEVNTACGASATDFAGNGVPSPYKTWVASVGIVLVSLAVALF